MLFCISHHPPGTRISVTWSPTDVLLPGNLEPLYQAAEGFSMLQRSINMRKLRTIPQKQSRSCNFIILGHPGVSHPWLRHTPQGRHFLKQCCSLFSYPCLIHHLIKAAFLVLQFWPPQILIPMTNAAWSVNLQNKNPFPAFCFNVATG